MPGGGGAFGHKGADSLPEYRLLVPSVGTEPQHPVRSSP